MTQPPPLRVSDNPEQQRYEAWAGEELAGLAAYQKAERLVVFTHTEVDPRFEGQGVGSALIRSLLDDVRGDEGRVLAVCPFAKAYLQRHPEYANLVWKP